MLFIDVRQKSQDFSLAHYYPAFCLLKKNPYQGLDFVSKFTTF
jgi:hypothetical protein